MTYIFDPKSNEIRIIKSNKISCSKSILPSHVMDKAGRPLYRFTINNSVTGNSVQFEFDSYIPETGCTLALTFESARGELYLGKFMGKKIELEILY